MKKKNKVSIIIPIYNAEKNLSKCLNSIINQTYSNYELITINDGSTDASLEILQKYKKDLKNKMKIINQTNRGAYLSRLEGIKSATGDYLMFIDSDDWIDKNTLEKLNSIIAENNNIDLVRFLYTIEPSGIKQEEYKFENILTYKNDFDFIYKQILTTFAFNFITTNFVRREILLKMDIKSIENLSQGEDWLMNMKILTSVNNIYFCNEYFYHYYVNKTSTTNTCDVDRVLNNMVNSLYVLNIKFDFYRSCNFDEEILNTMKQINLFGMYENIAKLLRNKGLTRKDLKNVQKVLEENNMYKYLPNKVEKYTNFLNKKIQKNIIEHKLYKCYNFKCIYRIIQIIGERL